MRRFFLTLAVLGLLVIPLWGQPAVVPYKIEFDPGQDKDVKQLSEFQGRKGLFLQVRFTITLEGNPDVEPGKQYKVAIYEDDHFVKLVDVPQPVPSEEMSVVMAMDISGSMSQFGRMEQARRAANVFFKSLPGKADAGLILFNHMVQKPVVDLTLDRSVLKQRIDSAKPFGGTAYIDATLKAIDMLKTSRRSKAVVVLTDGVDINSDNPLEKAIAMARHFNVRVYTVGIGEPGKQDQVTSVMVLDHSGSMLLPANDTDKVNKIEALKDAAKRFVNSIGSTRVSTIVEFGDDVQNPEPFTNNKFALKNIINKIQARGETALFDGVYTGLATLEAQKVASGNPKGKWAVVALTDGIDNKSRRRVDEVIQYAKDTKIPLFLLGFGRPGELDIATMTRMAVETKGKFYHAENKDKLIQLFEDLSIHLHDDGIDEKSLKKLAQETGGQYYAAKNVEKLDFILEKVTKNIQPKEYKITFLSRRQVADGLFRKVSLKLVLGSGDIASDPSGYKILDTKTGQTQTSGLVIAQMSPFVYLPFLALIWLLILLPGILKGRRETPS